MSDEVSDEMREQGGTKAGYSRGTPEQDLSGRENPWPTEPLATD